jgi:hypothetical protein
MVAEVQQNMFDGFGMALQVDGETHLFSFADGSNNPKGRNTYSITVLWVKENTDRFHLHTHELNRVLRFDERILLMRSTDVPTGTELYAEDRLTIDGEGYKIIKSRLKDNIWTLELQVLGSV